MPVKCRHRCFLKPLYNYQRRSVLYLLSLHDALPILPKKRRAAISHCFANRPKNSVVLKRKSFLHWGGCRNDFLLRSEEHTSELQSLRHLVCRLLVVKKKKESRGLALWLIAMSIFAVS